ncbi:MAG: Aerobic carbon monoxide dehydrogenase (quinone), medium chain [Ktedonobacterales bacterium]|nr:MAG: Aerobic carbon monoxide dehydrogenase (quinone), medium chain [Ktedonobacterales bacterium]
MIPEDFTYFAPGSLPEVWDLLRQHPDDAKILAGGQSLIPLMKFRLATPAYLIDLRKVPGLDTLAERDGALVIGAMVREAATEHSQLIQRRYPGIHEASAVVADPLVRNFATIGGNIAHADPANDHPAMLLALRASVVAHGPNGQRTIPLDDFLVDTMETSLAPDEVLTEIHVPQPAPRSGSTYLKLERKVGDYAIAAVGVQITLDGDVCTQAGIGLTNVGPKAVRATQAEMFLTGKQPTEDVIREAARLAAAAAQPVSDLHGPEDYKRAMIRTLTARALREATQRARAGGVSA